MLCELQASKALCLEEENTIFARRIRDILWFLAEDCIALAAQNFALIFLYPILSRKKAPSPNLCGFYFHYVLFESNINEISDEEYTI